MVSGILGVRDAGGAANPKRGRYPLWCIENYAKFALCGLYIP